MLFLVAACSGAPCTGDTTPLVLYIVLACAALAGLVIALIWFRRRAK